MEPLERVVRFFLLRDASKSSSFGSSGSGSSVSPFSSSSSAALLRPTRDLSDSSSDSRGIAPEADPEPDDMPLGPAASRLEADDAEAGAVDEECLLEFDPLPLDPEDRDLEVELVG